MIGYNEYWTGEPQEALDLALEFAQKGVQIDLTSHSGRLALGQVHFFRKNLSKSIESFERAIELNRNDSDAYAFLSQAFCLNGQSEKAIELLDHAFELNSYLGQWHKTQYVVAYFNARRYQDANDISETLESKNASYQRWIAANFAYLDREEEAQAAAQKYLESYPKFDLAEHLSRIPYAKKEDCAHYGNGLRMAGLK